MSSGLYVPASKNKEFICVENNLALPIVGGFVGGGASVSAVYTNSIGQSFNLIISVSAGGSIAPAGPSFVLSGGVPTYTVTVTFDRKYNGQFLFSATSLDNNPTAVDRICSASIGNPDILSTETEVVGNCLQALFNTNPATAKSFGWSELSEVTSFTFNFTRNNLGSITSLSIALTEKATQKWEVIRGGTTNTYIDLLTNISYTPNLPTGTEETQCDEDQRTVSWSEELCYNISSPINYTLCTPGTGIAQDAYNGITPRVDGVTPLSYLPGAPMYEFSPDGKRLYGVTNAGSLITNTYTDQIVFGGGTAAVLNFAFAGILIGMTVGGIAVHPTTGVIYVMYVSGANRLHLAKLRSSNIVEYIGDCQFTTNIAPGANGNDIVFTKSGQLLYAHAQNIYLVDTASGVIDPIASTIPSVTGNVFGISTVSRYYNGDILVSGSDVGIGPVAYIINGENYDTISQWGSNNSTTPPGCPNLIAYPQDPSFKFKRVFVKNIETNQVNYDDRSIVTGQQISIPLNASVGKCTIVDDSLVWTEDICYVVDTIPNQLGFIEIVGGQIVSVAPCSTVGGFVPPAAINNISITHSVDSDTLYAQIAGNQFQVYNWTAKATPTLSATIPITGFITVGETLKTIRTRWSDNSLWAMTEILIGSYRYYRFYTINKTTGALTFIAQYQNEPAPFTNGRFTWGLDDQIYIAQNIAGGLTGIYRLDKINFNVIDYIFTHNGIISQINTDIINKQFLISAASGITTYAYDGEINATCAGAYADALNTPSIGFQFGSQKQKAKLVLFENSTTKLVTAQYRDPITGQDIFFGPNYRIVSCLGDVSAKRNPRFIRVTGIATWQKSINAPNATSVSFTRVSGNVNINDGVNGAQLINFAATYTWEADILGNDLIFSGTAAGSSFTVNWIE
jgi:hypothetical protein